jgi:hypothetical protein
VEKRSCALLNLEYAIYNAGMATRRMLSLRIVDSARFLQMPLTAHALYFHLALHADDDGVVESFSVMRTTGAAQDDLKILLAKNFIRQLNDDLAVFVTDWHEHNFIRPDRNVNSVYKHLLDGTEMGRRRLGKVRLDNNVNENEPGRKNGAKRQTGLHVLQNLARNWRSGNYRR